MKKTIYLALSVLAAATVFASCNKTETEKVGEPSVTAVLDNATTTSLSYKLEPVNAVKCAWVILESNGDVPSAETVLAEGVPAHANEPSVVVMEDLAPNTGYKIVVAVENASKKTASVTVAGKTEDVPAIEFDKNRATGKKYGSTNFGITLRTEVDGVDYEADLDVYGDFSAGYVTAGTYTVSSGYEGNVVSTAYSGTYVQIGKDQKYPTSGTVTFAINDDKTYSIEIRFAFSDGTFFHGVFNGPIDGIEIL